MRTNFAVSFFTPRVAGRDDRFFGGDFVFMITL